MSVPFICIRIEAQKGAATKICRARFKEMIDSFIQR